MNQKADTSDDQSLDLADAEVERLLREAYDAPAVPRTLLKRIDQAVAQEWGVSPRLADRDPTWLTRLSRRGVRTLKSWPVAACVALGIVLAVAFRGDCASLWLGHDGRGVEQAARRASRRQRRRSQWPLCRRALAIGLRPRARTALAGRRACVRFTAQTDPVARRSEPRISHSALKDVSAAADRDSVLVSFLLGAVSTDSNSLSLSDLRVVNESWSRHGDTVELQVTLAGPGGGPGSSAPLHLSLSLDPDSCLPRTCQFRDSTGTKRELAFSYPQTDSATLLAYDFPPNLPVVEAEFAVSPNNAVVVAKNNSGGSSQVGGAKTPSIASGAPSAGAPNDRADPSPPAPLEGAASLNWAPVAKSDISDEEAVLRVNSLLERLWAQHNIEPAAPATDEELLRRVYLDLAGRTPTVTEVRNYLSDTAPDRYTALVDRLLDSRDHATHLATVWRRFLLPEGMDLSRFGGIEAFDEWLGGQFGQNVSYDELVRKLLLAEGRLSKSGPLLFYAALKLDADQLAARTSQVFLGMRLGCAQCHDDPFEPWTQRDFWSYAAFFARISRPQAKLETVSTVMRVSDVDRGDVKLPDTETVVPPRFLDGAGVDDSPQAAARRRQLALWLTSPQNPFFARAAVNRVWAQMFGRGITDPVDGFGERHPPCSPELLDLLAGQFVRGGFNMRELFRMIALTDAYRRSSGAKDAVPARLEWFAQMNVKPLTPEQVYDCVYVASMLAPADSAGFNIARVRNARRDEFLQQFQTLAGRPTEYQAGIPQALTLMNGALIHDATGLASSGLLKSLEAPFFTDDQRIEVIYLATLSRRPSAAEWNALREFVSGREPGVPIQEPLADILWALLNSAEFTMNH